MPDTEYMVRHIEMIGSILQTVAVLIGVVLVAGAIFQFKKYGESRTMMSGQHSLAGPLMMMVAGSALLSLPLVIKMTLLAFMGSASPLSYETYAGYSIEPAIVFIRVVGIGSFIRGIVLLSRTGHQQGQPGNVTKALIHILAGALCIHVIGTYDLVYETFFQV